MKRELIKERLSYIPITESGCWIWMGATTHFGHGRIVVRGKHFLTHRASWVAHRGPIPEGMCVLHRCDVPSCINPDHLFLGTREDNTLDMVQKGRGKWIRGTDVNTNKLTPEQVIAIRNSSDGPAALARRYGVHRENIRFIRQRKTWKHI